MTENELTSSATHEAWVTADIEVSVPAHPDFFAVIRSMARSASALADLTVSDVEELQIAVDEAATLLLPLVEAQAPAHIRARFEIASGRVCAELRARCVRDVELDTSGMAWIMLTGLDPHVRVIREGQNVSIAIERQRSDPDQ